MDEKSKQNSVANSPQPELIDRMMTVVEVKSWVAIGTIGIIFVAMVIWGFCGTMQVRDEVSGVLVRSGKIIDIFADSDSVILDVSVERGDSVIPDQVLTRIEQAELIEKINLLLRENADNSQEIEVLRQELIQKSQISVAEAGTVYDVYVRPGQYIKRGEKIVTIQVDAGAEKSLECLLFVPVGQMKDIRIGQQVNVFPMGASKKTYGNMTGRVSFISDYPVTLQYLYDTVGSEEIAASFLSASACYEVALTLDISEETPTGFKWTTSMGPSKPFGKMTLCDASVIIAELRPIEVFFFDN
jgi:biotin carboxyl carrier protein